MKNGGPLQRGVSVDAIGVYIERLPEVPGLARVHAAVVGWEPHNASVETWYVAPEDLVKYYATDKIPQWLRGCNTVGRPFQLVVNELTKLNLLHVYQNKQVPAFSVSEVLLAHEGCRTKLLKIDTEGFDTILLIGYSDFLWTHPECWADLIQFETVHSTAAQVAGALQAMKEVGYSKCGEEVDQGGGPPDIILCYLPKLDVRLQASVRLRSGLKHSEEEVLKFLSGEANLEERGGEGEPSYREEILQRPCGKCPWT